MTTTISSAEIAAGLYARQLAEAPTRRHYRFKIGKGRFDELGHAIDPGEIIILAGERVIVLTNEWDGGDLVEITAESDWRTPPGTG